MPRDLAGECRTRAGHRGERRAEPGLDLASGSSHLMGGEGNTQMSQLKPPSASAKGRPRSSGFLGGQNQAKFRG